MPPSCGLRTCPETCTIKTQPFLDENAIILTLENMSWSYTDRESRYESIVFNRAHDTGRYRSPEKQKLLPQKYNNTNNQLNNTDTLKDLSYSQKRTFHIDLMIMASICTLPICQNCVVQHNNSMLLAVKRVGKREEQASNMEQVQKKELSGRTRAHSIHCHLDWTSFSNKKSLLWNNLWKQRLCEVPCEEIFQHWTICKQFSVTEISS